jgi:hypothetical protein
MSYDALAYLQRLFREDALPGYGFAPGHEMQVEDLDGEWRVWFEERAAIMEYNGGMPRERAEAETLADILRQMNRPADIRGAAK